MGSPQDIAVGRALEARGWIDGATLRAVYAALPPQLGLLEALVSGGHLPPERAATLRAELGLAPPGGSAPATLLVSPAHPGQTAGPPAGPSFSTLVSDSSHAEQGAGGLPRPGELVGGRYEVQRVLGQGGMGAVFLAQDRARGAAVALKVMLPGAAGEAALLRFRREAEALAKVDDHVGIVRIRDFGRDGGRPYAALDLIEGRDLHARVKEEGPLPLTEATRLAEAVARAIEHCHQRGVLHRDLKPANVLVRERDGAPFVTDFGLAHDASDTGERLTQTGQIMGTPAYMPPEQAEGDLERIDARSDVYSLGALLYELVGGRPPFQGEGLAIVKKVLLDEPQELRQLRPDAPADLAAVVHRAMAKDPRARYASAGSLADELARLLRGEPVSARAPSRAELLAWRRSQGDKRAWAEWLATRVLLPLGLLGGLGIGVSALRVPARYGVWRAEAEALPAALATPLRYPGAEGTEAWLAGARGPVQDLCWVTLGEVPSGLDLAAQLDLALAAPGAPRARWAPYLARLRVALGQTPGPNPGGATDPASDALALLVALGYGGGPLADAIPAPNEQGDPERERIERALRQTRAELERSERDGWRALTAGREAGAWSGESYAKPLAELGGAERWAGWIAREQARAKRSAAEQATPELVRAVREADPLALDRILLDGLAHLSAPPAVERAPLDQPLLELGLETLNLFSRDADKAARLAERLTESAADQLIDWRAVREAAKRAGQGGQWDLIYPYQQRLARGERIPVSVLVICVRMDVNPFVHLANDLAGYGQDLRSYVTRVEQRPGVRPSGAAYLLLAELRLAELAETEVDRDNPELVLQGANLFANALGPSQAPLDLAPYGPGLIATQPGSALGTTWRRRAECHLFALLFRYEDYLLRRPQPEDHAARRQGLAEAFASWCLAHGAEAPVSSHTRTALLFARYLRLCQDEFRGPEVEALAARSDEALLQALKATLAVARASGVLKEEIKQTEDFSVFDRTMDPRQLERTVGNLCEAYAERLARRDPRQALAALRQVHQEYASYVGRPSPRVYKASAQLALASGLREEARVEIEALLAFVDTLKDPETHGYPELANSAELAAGARAWLADLALERGDVAEARRIYAEAERRGQHTHDHWGPVLPKLERAEGD